MRRLNTMRGTLIFAGLAIMVGYNNCGQVRFGMDVEGLKSKLNADGGLLINEGAEFTNSQDVQLSLIHNGADEMYITNVPGCDGGGDWAPYSVNRAWKLPAANSEGKVYVKYREKAVPSAESDCFSDSIVHDDIAPVIRVTRDVASYVNTPSARVEFIVDDAGSGLGDAQCAVGSGAAAACRDVAVADNLSEGAATIRITAKDRAGNEAAPVQSHFIVDRTAPVVTLNQTPAKVTSSLTAAFQFSATDALAGIDRFECRLDGQAGFTACLSPHSAVVAEGARRFQVRAYDRAGNVSDIASHDWTIDLTAPSVRIVKAPAPHSNSGSAAFEFEGTDGLSAISRLECSVDGGPYAACASPQSYQGLAAGDHRFSVIGIDSAGNRSAPASHAWSIDLTPPTVQIVARPEPINNRASATIAFSAQDAGSGVDRAECQIDGTGYQPCSSPKTYGALAEGPHSVQVRAYDRAGNVSSPAVASWTIDLTKPQVEILSGPLAMTNAKEASFEFRAADPNGTGPLRVECRIDNSAYAPCSSPALFPVSDEGHHAFYLRATDAAGNVSDVKTHLWTLDSVAPAINFAKRPLSVIQNTAAAEILFNVTDAGSGVDAVLCGFKGQLVPCNATEERRITGLAPGDYVFEIEAKDRAGNTGRNEVSWRVELGTQNHVQDVKVTANAKADILVVIDNSGSMNTEQKNMAARFGTFLDQLKNLDWQVAIITTDVDSDSDKRDGRLLKFNGTSLHILDSKMDPAAARQAFGATVQRSQNEGSGNEQGIRATYRAVERSQNNTLAVNAPNRAFFRPGAALAVIVVTDADETNPKGTFPSNNGENLNKLIAETWLNQKPFSFHSIIVKPGDKACKAQAENEDYGHAYEALSKLTGGVVGTVCAPDYGSQLTTIGNGVVELVRSATLKCPPIDTNGDGKADVEVTTADMSAVPAYVIEGNKITFATPLPLGDNRLEYACLAAPQ